MGFNCTEQGQLASSHGQGGGVWDSEMVSVCQEDIEIPETFSSQKLAGFL